MASKQSSLSELSISLPLFEKRIEFHLARKPFTGFSNSGGSFRLETLNPSNSNSLFKTNLVAKNVDESVITESKLDPELSYQISFRRIGAGLANLGNTCFLNSVLQCLTYTEPLAAYLQSGKHQSSCRTAGFCALCAIQKHVSSALQSTGRILVPKEIVSNLRCISHNFRNFRQEDAHEYMVNLLESMHKCCLPSGVPSESPSAYDKSSVHKIFGGRLRSQVKCTQCSYSSDKFDPFLDLSLEIGKADSLYKALTHFTAKELLDGGERHYQCQQCKQKVKAIKQLTIHKAPYVLTIHLKRFTSHLAGQKIDKKITFGTTLDLKPFVTDPCDEALKYTLYGVLVHAGWSTHSGHYYCFVRTSSGMWYSLDDNQVIQVSEKRVLEQKAYMLFYYRDRRNSSSNKSFDVVQKHNANSTEKAKSNCGYGYGLKETLSGQIEKKVSGTISSAAVAQRNSLNGDVPWKPIIKDAPAECSTPNKDSLVEHPSSRGGIKCLLQKDSSAKCSSLPLKDNPIITISNAKAVECGVDTSVKECANNLIDPSSSDNILKSVNGNALCDSNCGYGQGLKETLSGQIEKKVSGTICSAAVAQRNSLNVDVPWKPIIKDALAECSTPNKDSLVEHPSSRGGIECLLQKDSSAKCSSLPLKDNPIITISNAKAVECGVDTSVKKCANSLIDPSSSDNFLKCVNGNALCDSGARLPNGSDSRNSQRGLYDAVAKSPNSALLDKSPTVAAEKAFSGENPSWRPMDKTNPVTTASATALNNSQATVPDLSTLPITKHTSMQKKVHEEKTKRRLKKFSKCPTMKMQLSLKFSLKTSLCVRKKKFKRSRKGKLVSTNLLQNYLVDGDSISSDLEPSTSQKYQTPSGGLDHSQRGRKKRDSKKIEKSCVVNNMVSNLNGDSMTNNEVESGERTGQNGAVLALNNPTEKFSVSASAGNSLNARGPFYSKDGSKEFMQNGLRNVLTRGLEGTIVARWDETGSNATQRTKRSDVGNGSIGHIGDEWDEEYDRGKRKKVRSFKHDFNGPNPFQEIATMQSKIKKARMDYSSSGNKPFRIC